MNFYRVNYCSEFTKLGYKQSFSSFVYLKIKRWKENVCMSKKVCEKEGVDSTQKKEQIRNA